MRRMPLRASACLVVAVLAAALASSARAAISVEISPTQGLRIDVDDSGSQLSVRPLSDPDELLVVEANGRPLVAGAGCRITVPTLGGTHTQAQCSLPTVRFVTLFGGATTDRLVLAAGAGDCRCSGGAGDDEIIGATGADAIDGGDGADTLTGGGLADQLRGGAGADTLDGGEGDDDLAGGSARDRLTGGLGDDRLDGGGDVDTFNMGNVPDGADVVIGTAVDIVDYSGRRGSLAITLGNDAPDDGASAVGQIFGERDNLAAALTHVRGGAGDDRIVGGPQSDRLFGNGGDDDLRGGAGSDVLDGGVGVDRLRGEDGTDQLEAADAIDDQAGAALSCGPGQDFLRADLRDTLTRALPADCEAADQGAVREDPNVDIRSARRASGGALVVTLACPRGARTGCKGRLAASAAPPRAVRFGPATRYTIRRGRRATVRVRLPAGARAAARARVRSVEHGRLGQRTTLQTLRVSAS